MKKKIILEELKKDIEHDAYRIGLVVELLDKLCNRAEEVPSLYIGYEIGKVKEILEKIRMEMLDRSI